MHRRLFALSCGVLLGIFACTGDAPDFVGDSPNDAGGGQGNDAAPPEAGAPAPVVCTAPETACGKACADLETSDDHCGRCDHSCKGDGCSKGRCLPADLLDGLTFPTAIATHDGTTQVLVNAGGTVVKCAKTGCGKVPTPLWLDNRLTTNEGSPVALTHSSFATLVYDESMEQKYLFDRIEPLGSSPPIYTPPTTFERLAADNTPDGGNDVAGQQGYAIYGCPGGVCAEGLAVSYATEDGELNVAIQPGNPGYYLWNTYSNIHYCARGSATSSTPCPRKNLVETDIPTPLGLLAVTATRAYWASHLQDGYRVYACPFPAGCASPTLLVEGEAVMDGFAADDDGIYWTDRQNGFLRACLDTVNGCGKNAVQLLSNLAQPYGIALDKTTVFFTQRAGTSAQGKVTRLHR